MDRNYMEQDFRILSRVSSPETILICKLFLRVSSRQ